MAVKRKLILYIAQSLDGYIAADNDDISWLSMVEKPGEDYGYHQFLNDVDTVIMGRRTYDKVLSFGIEFPHKARKCYVVSKTKTGSDENVEFIGDQLKTFVESLKQQPGKNIYLDGGASLVQEFLKLGLIDEMVISVIPILLGESPQKGIRLFGPLKLRRELKLLESQSFESGLIQLRYALK